MVSTDPRVDAYIARSAGFARPILIHLRTLVHIGCPDVQETMKWSFPHFMHRGILCSMASFKAHCAFGFWKGALIGVANLEAMGSFGRITTLRDLPRDKVLVGYVKEAARLNEAGVKVPRQPRPPKKPISVPADLKSALRKNAKARATFDALSPSHKREYVEWITEAKRAETRKKRLTTAVESMAAGKSQHWKYRG